MRHRGGVRRAGDRPEALGSLPSPDLRQGGTVPPDRETVAGQQPKAKDLEGLQAQLDRFRRYYNTERPHRSLRRRTPVEAFEARPKAVPSRPGFVVPVHYRVRKDRVDGAGKITLRYKSRLLHVGLGRRYARRRVLVLVADLHVRVLTADGELIRDLVLDPDRSYQPQG